MGIYSIIKFNSKYNTAKNNGAAFSPETLRKQQFKGEYIFYERIRNTALQPQGHIR